MGLSIHFVVDPQGWCCVGAIFFIWFYNTLFIPKLILFPRFDEGQISVAAIWAYYLTSIFCIISLLRASTADPGKLQDSPKIPLTEKELWELCNKCNMMRPKRSHHCSRCGHCVRRMDHHCPWINNCVGEDNHWLFLQLCFYTQLLSGYTLVLDFCHYYYFLPLAINWDIFIFRHELALLRISTFMGIVMFGGMCSLFYTQIMGILTIESSKAMAADLLRSFWHSLEDPVVHSFQAEATTARLLLLCQSCLNRWMVGTDGFAMLEASYRFYHNSAMTVFKSIIIHPPIFNITKCPRLYFNSDLNAVVGTV
uniref:Palmitoyltransferase n=1 Tax=Xenopus tropicalis TaxID=8364 RepID=A0A6I8PJD5_XENTR